MLSVWNHRDDLAKLAVDVVSQGGATFADARITRTVQHGYSFGSEGITDVEEVGIGVRALVDGCWGFTACPTGDRATVERLAKGAVAQAKVNARVVQTNELGKIPTAVGTWATPISIDPFSVPIEEKLAFMESWQECAMQVGLRIDELPSYLRFVRQDRLVATSEGGHFSQTVFESGGQILLEAWGRRFPRTPARLPIQGIAAAGRGWELFLEAKIAESIRAMPPQLEQLIHLQQRARPATVGRYTLVCDGATMAAMLSATLGTATQLDRALGYEANAGGTSFLDDPLTMLGAFPVAAPIVNVTANRSAAAQLATVQWDDEGVVPVDITLVKHGVLTDFQTTREQAAWLAPYYTTMGREVRSNGCAAAENALYVTMQQMPNLALEAGNASVHLDDLVANVKDGLLIEGGQVIQIDSQARNGLLLGTQLRKIQNGKAGTLLSGGAVQFNTLDLWKHILAIGGSSTLAVVPFSQYPYGGAIGQVLGMPVKGEPPQMTSHSVAAVAATIANQPLIDPSRKI